MRIDATHFLTKEILAVVRCGKGASALPETKQRRQPFSLKLSMLRTKFCPSLKINHVRIKPHTCTCTCIYAT